MLKKVKFAEPSVSPAAVKPSSRDSVLKPAHSVSHGSRNLITQLFWRTVEVSPATLRQVLQATLKAQLAGSFRTRYDEESSDSPPSCLEVYTVLHLCLKWREGASAMAGHADTLINCARRDFDALQSSQNPLDVRVLVQILRVVETILSTELTVPTVNSDTVRYFFAKAINLLGTEGTSKALIGVCIRLFSTAAFAKAVSTDLAEGLLAAIAKRPAFSSAALAADYLTAIRLLRLHHSSLMISKADLWVPEVVYGLMDSSAFVRQQALQVANDCNRKNIGEKEIGRALTDTLDNHFSDGAPIGVVFAQKLSTQLGVQGEGRLAMNIWTAVTLIINAHTKIEDWPLLSNWLEVCKQGFYSPFLSTKEATLVAWRAAVYAFAFQGSVSSFERNLQVLLFPFRQIKQLRSNSGTMLVNYQRIFNSILYIGFRVVAHNAETLECIWKSLIVPALNLFVTCPDPEGKAIAVTYFVYFISQANASPRGDRSRVLDDLELAEVGNFPLTWIKQSTPQILDLLHDLSNLCTEGQTQDMWQAVINVCKQSMAYEIHQSDESLAQLAALVSHIVRSGIAELGNPLIESLGVGALMSKRMTYEGKNTVKSTKVGTTSALSVILTQVFDSGDIASTLSLLTSKGGSLQRTLNILSAAVAASSTSMQWSLVAIEAWKHVETVDNLAADNLDQIMGILVAGARFESPEMWIHWARLFEVAHKRHGRSEPFVNVLRQLTQADTTTLLSLKAASLYNHPDFDEPILRLLTIEAVLDADSTRLPESFRLVLARHLMSTYSNSSLVDFERILAYALSLVEANVQPELFAIALGGSFMPNVQLAVAEWNTRFGEREDIEFGDDLVRTILGLREAGLEIAITPNLPTPVKRKLPLSPSSSPPRSPTEDLVSVKRQRMSEDVDRPLQLKSLATPPGSDDLENYAMQLFRQLHETDDPAEISSIRRKGKSLPKPARVPQFDELCSSPPAEERYEGLKSLKRALMRADLDHALPRASRSECLLLEKMLMDSLVSIRIHLAGGE